MAGVAPAGAKLDSWKAIAAHLGREVRTVQRWEKHEGLPVHRLGHQKQGSVFAFAHELDAWIETRRAAAAPPLPVEPAPAEPPPAQPLVPRPGATSARRRPWLWASLLVIAVAGAWFWGHRPAVPPSQSAAAPSPLPPPPLPDVQQLFAAATADGGTLPLIAAGPQPYTLALARGDRELYAANPTARTITVVDTAQRRAVASLHLAAAPDVLAATPDGQQVFAASADEDGLSVIQTATRQVSWIGLQGGVRAMAMAPDGRQLYLAQGFNGLTRFDLATREITHLATAACPSALAMAPDGRTLYVGYECGGPAGRRGHDSIGVFDTVHARFTATIAGDVPMVASAMAVSPDGNELWSSSGDACTAAYDHVGCLPNLANLIYVFDTHSGRLLSHIPLGPDPPERLRFLAGGTRLLAGAEIVDATRHEVLEALPDAVAGAAVAGDGRAVYLSLPQRDAVGVFLAPSRACAPPPRQLVAWWPGDGSTADLRGMLAGLASPGLAFAPAKNGQGFAFDGRSQVNFGHDASIQRRWSDGLTVAAWVKSDRTPAGNLLARQSPDRRRGWRLGFNATGALQACFGALPACITAPAAWLSGQWHLVALSAAPAAPVTLFVDGQAVAQLSPPADADAGGSDLIAGENFRGVMDDVVFYTRALDSGDLQALLALPACIQAAHRGNLETP